MERVPGDLWQRDKQDKTEKPKRSEQHVAHGESASTLSKAEREDLLPDMAILQQNMADLSSRASNKRRQPGAKWVIITANAA